MVWEIFFGGAVHDGSINGTSDLNALGSRVLFNVGGSVGYRFDAHWSVMATFDHMSNGKSVFDLAVSFTIRASTVTAFEPPLAFSKRNFGRRHCPTTSSEAMFRKPAAVSRNA